MEETSARENEVLDLVGDGLTNAQIAARLFISVRTVESHVSALLRKLEVVDRRALAGRVAERRDTNGSLRGAPEAFTSFIGREDDLAGVVSALAGARLVALTGPGGIGKTRLAIEAGRRATADVKWFVDLVPAVPAQVITTIATAVGVAERPDQSLEQAVHDVVAGRPALIVLDNCEHVLDAAAAATQRLLQACPDAIVLATTREVLGVPGERVVPVRPLAVFGPGAPAVALFVARAGSAGAVISESDHGAIAEICARLDGIPLAVELAAARAATLGVDGVLDALNDRFRLLAGARGADERHRSLRAVLDWSYSLLSAEEQLVLRRVSVFQGGFRLADAAAVAGGEIGRNAAADAVARLAAKSLAVHGRGESGSSGYRLLETVRAYGLDELEAAGEGERIRDRHLAWAVALAGELEREMEDDDSVPSMLDAVFDDLRAALTWAETRSARDAQHDLGRRLAHLAYRRRFVSEAHRLYRAAAGSAPDAAAAARSVLDAAHAAFAMMRGDLGYECLLESAGLAELGGDGSGAASALALAAELGNRCPAEFANLPERRVLDDLIDRARSVGADADAAALLQIEVATAWRSAMTEAFDTGVSARRALAAAVSSGDAVFESSALDALSAAAWQAGDLARSAEICLERVPLLDRLAAHDPRAGKEQLDILHMASDVPLSRGDLVGGLEFSRGAMDHPLAAGAPHLLRRELVMALCLTGRFDEALAAAATMRAAWERTGRPVAGWMAPAAFLAALVAGLRGDRAGYSAWWALGDDVCLSPENAARAFAAVRLALHDGRVEDAADEIERHLAVLPVHDSNFPWSLAALGYDGYLWSIAAEVWVVRRAADAAERVLGLREAFAEHLWAVPCLLRAEGRLRDDAALLQAAADGFAAIDARFEEATTLLLIGGDARTRGDATLAELGCTLPVIT